jgi:hypothetical protein
MPTYKDNIEIKAKFKLIAYCQMHMIAPQAASHFLLTARQSKTLSRTGCFGKVFPQCLLIFFDSYFDVANILHHGTNIVWHTITGQSSELWMKEAKIKQPKSS